LSKLGHVVTVLERNADAGGAIRRIEHNGYAWDAGPASTTIPAVLRDLFRKSGRPIEQYVDLVMREPARRHVFEDGTSVDQPSGSRAVRETGWHGCVLLSHCPAFARTPVGGHLGACGDVAGAQCVYVGVGPRVRLNIDHAEGLRPARDP
jgi:hypothetical protein